MLFNLNVDEQKNCR